jgi:Domain of unknown function (DUF4386)
MNHDTRSLRTASLTAGIALALMAVLAPIGVFGAVGALITPGDAARTAQNIVESQALFRWGIASLILVAVLDIVVAAALFTLFAPVNRSVSAMAAGFRVAYAAVYLVAITQLVVALGLLSDPDQAIRAIDAYTTIWHVGLILFGVHLLLLGYLGYRSGYMAKVFGILLVVAGLGYLADGFGAVLVRGYALDVGRFTFVGEVALIFWLLIKGSRKDFRRGQADRGDQVDPDFFGSRPGGMNTPSPVGVGEVRERS